MAVSFSPCTQKDSDDIACHKTLKLVSAGADKSIFLWDWKEILAIETNKDGKNAFESLFNKGCQWLSVYLATNPDTPEAEDIRYACGNKIKPQQD